MEKKNYLLWFWRIFYPLALYYVVTVIMQVLFMLFFTLSVKNSSMDIIAKQELIFEQLSLATIPILLLSALVVFPIFRFLIRKDHQKKRQSTGIIIYENITQVQQFLVIGLGFSLCIFLNNLINFAKIIELFPTYLETSEALYDSTLALKLLGIGIIVPIIEEMLFRGLCHNRIKEYLRPKIAIILSSLIFGLYHMNMVQIIYATFLGLALAYVYEKFHTLKAPILLHISANILSVLSTEIPFIERLFEEPPLAFIATILSLLAAIIILYKIYKVKQKSISTLDFIED